MKCSISTYYKILDAELYNYDDGYMKHMQMSKERKPICTANARSAERN